MTCLNSTISTPERVLIAALGAVLLGAAPPAGPAAELIARAESDLDRNDGIAAEVRLKQALDKGATRDAIAALMGEALLDQGEAEKARGWLVAGQFDARTASRGWRQLARLEQNGGNLHAAGLALDRAMALTPKDPEMWVEIGRLRFIGGEHALAQQAADYALSLAPHNVRALEYKGQIVRDQFGLASALPWFEAGLIESPGDLSLLGEYAATLGDMGRAGECVAITRRMIELDPKDSRAFYMQAVIAARAGNVGLARKLLAKGGKDLADLPGAMLMRGALELGAGNPGAAIEALEPLVARQPGNEPARLLLARAIYRAGDFREVVRRFAPYAEYAEASPYLLTLVARAHEALGRRDLAAPLLDRAARARLPLSAPVRDGSEIGWLVAHGRLGEATAQTGRNLTINGGSANNLALAGDVALAKGDNAAAFDRYAAAAALRMSDSLIQRMTLALQASGRPGMAVPVVENWLAMNPQSRPTALLAAEIALAEKDASRAVVLLKHLRADGGERDVRVLAMLSAAQRLAGEADDARISAEAAYGLQRMSPIATSALAEAGGPPSRIAALKAKLTALTRSTSR